MQVEAVDRALRTRRLFWNHFFKCARDWLAGLLGTQTASPTSMRLPGRGCAASFTPLPSMMTCTPVPGTKRMPLGGPGSRCTTCGGCASGPGGVPGPGRRLFRPRGPRAMAPVPGRPLLLPVLLLRRRLLLPRVGRLPGSAAATVVGLLPAGAAAVVGAAVGLGAAGAGALVAGLVALARPPSLPLPSAKPSLFLAACAIGSSGLVTRGT